VSYRNSLNFQDIAILLQSNAHISCIIHLKFKYPEKNWAHSTMQECFKWNGQRATVYCNWGKNKLSCPAHLTCSKSIQKTLEY